MDKTAYLVLENGTIFQGKAFGAEVPVIGELVFTTGMTGYLETLTDKSYHGQIVVQTFPLIGNYGVIPADFEGDRIGPAAYIVQDWCQYPSNFRSAGDIDTFLKEQNIAGLCDIDTRALTKLLRENGVMNGQIVYDRENIDVAAIKNYRVEHAVEAVTCECKMGNGHSSQVEGYRVVLLDFGYKENIKRELEHRGCEVILCRAGTKAKEILAIKPDGIMLSNGPGDPAENTEIIQELRILMDSGIPMFGICLGHQLLALANGFRTAKLKYGHRGANQPVKDMVTGQVVITTQNHGYEVISSSIREDIASERYVNVNDGSCEGIDYKNAPVFSVQFHPEACAGPRDSEFLFQRFLMMIQQYKGQCDLKR